MLLITGANGRLGRLIVEEVLRRAPEVALAVSVRDVAAASGLAARGVEVRRGDCGLMTVKGRFDRYDGTLQLNGRPAVALAIDADSLDTKHGTRDKHLRSADFFDVAHHPQVRFESDDAALAGDTLKVRGQLHAAGRSIPLDIDAAMREVDGELEVEASALADHRNLGMTWSPLGIMRAPSKLIVRGRLVRKERQS
jgi:polyisoprenoid-binding protein YceI